MRFRVTEYGNYCGVKEIEAETKEEANEKYLDDPCTSNEYDYDNVEIEVEEEEER